MIDDKFIFIFPYIDEFIIPHLNFSRGVGVPVPCQEPELAAGQTRDSGTQLGLGPGNTEL